MKIDKNIPLTPKGFGLKSGHHFYKMEVGDSILIRNTKKALSFICAARNYTRIHKLNWKFKGRKVKQGTRIWRTN